MLGIEYHVYPNVGRLVISGGHIGFVAPRRWITRQLAIDALNMAIKNGCLEPELTHQSDRGVQYASNEFQLLFKFSAA
jgi:transposase InsO family protein